MVISVATMNVHLKSLYNLQKFSGIVQNQNLDIVVVAETWFEVNSSKKIMGKYLAKISMLGLVKKG